jgi:uncharacterized protein YkwD
VVAVVAALVLLLVQQGGSREPRPFADSPCGAVHGLPGELGVERTRELTLCLLNGERSRNGLSPLRRSVRLELASQRHSEDMVGRKFFEHDTPEGIDPQERIVRTGYPVNNAITGENIAWGTGPKGSPAEIVDLWMHSPPHRENILRAEFTEVGVGVAAGAPEDPKSSDPPVTYTTDFGGPPVR